MAPNFKISKANRFWRNKENRNSRRLSDMGGLSYEKFEPRLLLSATAEFNPLQEQLILDYIASTPATAYLQLGENDLQFVAADTDSTTALFQQTVNGIAVQGAYITVVQQDGVVQEVFDRGFENLVTDDGNNPFVSVVDAEMIADHSLGDRNPAMSSELVWYHLDDGAELTWQVSTFLDESTDEFPTADYITYVDADSGVVLRQETPFELVEYLLEQPDVEVGEYARIVINNAIGAAGSRAYAAPFDAVVDVGGCTGTLIASNVVLTARHCGAGAGTQVRFGDNGAGPTFTVQSSFLPDGGGSLLDGGDVAILTLTSNVPTSVATPMRLIGETSSLVGEVAATLGYGYNGLGSSGHGFSADGFRWGGENIIDRYGSPAGSSGSNIFSTDFDSGSAGNNTISGSDPNPLEFEATTAPGDSGGPILVQVGGEWVIAGVLSGGTTSTSVYGDISWWTGIADFQAAIEARGGVFVGSGTGSVAFDAGSYRIDDTFTVTVSEANPQPPISVTIVSDSGDSETFVLSGSGSTYTSGNILVSDGAVSTNDGILQVNIGDEITVTYVDPDDGSGNSSVETDTATILDVSSVLVGIDFDQSSGVNPTNWREITTGGNTTFGDLNDEEGNPTAIDFTINETPNGSWNGFAATINANTIPNHAVSLANLDGQIYNGADTFVLTYSDLNPLTNYELYVFGLEGLFASIQQRVTITGDGTPITFDQNFNQNDLFINDQVGSSSQDLSSYAQIVTADSSGNIVININPIGGTQDVVLGGIAIAEVAITILGDANDDGVFDNLDIAPFVLALTDATAYAAANPDVDPDVVLDMNDDGVFDNQDIAAFVAALTGGRNLVSGDANDDGSFKNVEIAASSLALTTPTRSTLTPTRSGRSANLLPPIIANDMPTVSNENIARENYFASNHLFSVDQLVGTGEREFQLTDEAAVHVGDRFSGTDSAKLRLSKRIGVATPARPVVLNADRQSTESIGDKAQFDRRDRAFTKLAADESGRLGKAVEIDLLNSLNLKI